MASDCLFCRIAAGELGTRFVYQDTDVVAFADLHPQAPTHILVIPRIHLASLADSGPDHDLVLGKVLAGVRTVAAQLGLAHAGYRTAINTGAGAGQSVFHLHAHLLAGRAFAWPPG